MSCGCSTINNGKQVADLVRSKGFENMQTKKLHNITCSCGNTFIMDKLICKCNNKTSPLASGMNAHLSKPVDLDTLCALLQSMQL